MVVEALEPDLALADPARHFGPGTGRLVLEAIVAPVAGGLSLGPGTPILPATGGLALPAAPARMVLDLLRGPDGGFRATASRAPGAMADAGGGPGAPGRPAPRMINKPKVRDARKKNKR
jgi:hypothetical protein